MQRNNTVIQEKSKKYSVTGYYGTSHYPNSSMIFICSGMMHSSAAVWRPTSVGVAPSFAYEVTHPAKHVTCEHETKKMTKIHKYQATRKGS